MSEPLFKTINEKRVAEALLKAYRGKTFNPNAVPEVEVTLDDGSIYDFNEGRQPYNFWWLIKKMINFRILCMYEMLKKVEDFDSHYYHEVLMANNSVGPTATAPKDVIAGKVSSRFDETSEQDRYIFNKDDAVARHKESMKTIDYYFKIDEFVHQIAGSVSEEDPPLALLYQGIFGGEKIKDTLEYLINQEIPEETLPELKVYIDSYKHDKNGMLKDSLINGTRHIKDTRLRRMELDLPFINLEDAEIDEFIEFTRPNLKLSKKHREFYENYVGSKARSAEADMRKLNAEIWKKFDYIKRITGKERSDLFELFTIEGKPKFHSMHPPIKLENGKTYYFMGYDN